MLEHETGFIFWELITFALIVFLLRRFAWKYLAAILTEREIEIRSALEKALANWGKAEETFRLARATVADRDRVIAAMLRDAERTSEELKRTLRALAERQAEVTIEEAGKEIRRLERQAIIDLRSEVSAMVVDVAGNLIDSELTNRHHSMLIDSAIRSLAFVEAQQATRERE